MHAIASFHMVHLHWYNRY